MSNLSKQRRDEMIAYLNRLKEIHTDDTDRLAINKIEEALLEKKYGLVWEEHSEKVDEELIHNIPVFTEDEGKKIVSNEEDGYNFCLREITCIP